MFAFLAVLYNIAIVQGEDNEANHTHVLDCMFGYFSGDICKL